MNERHEHPERADQAGGHKRPTNRRVLIASCSRAPYPASPNQDPDLHGIAIRPQAAIPWIVLDQQSQSATHDGSKTTEQKVGLAPPHGIDEESGEWRHDNAPPPPMPLTSQSGG